MDRSDPAGPKTGSSKAEAMDTLEKIKELMAKVEIPPDHFEEVKKRGMDYSKYPGLEHYPPEAFRGEQSIDQICYWDPLEDMFSEYPVVQDEEYIRQLTQKIEKFEKAYVGILNYLQTPDGHAIIEQLAKEHGFEEVEQCLSSIEGYMKDLVPGFCDAVKRERETKG